MPFQIGHEYRYASWVVQSIARIQKGEIGKPTHIFAYWNRNNNWRRPVPQPDPDGHLEHLINWRLYRETSGGLGTELGSLMSAMASTPTSPRGGTGAVRSPRSPPR